MEKIQSDLDLLAPQAKKKFDVFFAIARKEFDVFAFETKRTIIRQYELLWQWRSVAECRKYGVHAKYSRPLVQQRTRTLQSKHLTGEAVDVVFDLNKDPKIKVPARSWNYKRLIEIGKYCGLRNLAPLETCHFEDNGVSIKNTMENNSKERHKTTDQWLKALLSQVNDLFRGL